MAKKLTKEQLKAEIAKTETELKQSERYINQLVQQNKQQIQRARTRRLIERGAIAESFINGADNLTNEQFKSILFRSINPQIIKEMLTTFQEENNANPQS